MSRHPIVSIGFLTQRDLAELGETFTDHIPISNDDLFADLLSQLDQIEIERSVRPWCSVPRTSLSCP